MFPEETLKMVPGKSRRKSSLKEIEQLPERAAERDAEFRLGVFGGDHALRPVAYFLSRSARSSLTVSGSRRTSRMAPSSSPCTPSRASHPSASPGKQCFASLFFFSSFLLFARRISHSPIEERKKGRDTRRGNQEGDVFGLCWTNAIANARRSGTQHYRRALSLAPLHVCGLACGWFVPDLFHRAGHGTHDASRESNSVLREN
eukprot:1178908-Prorocentrum_minimum.AAC.3